MTRSLRELLNAATPGKWCAEHDKGDPGEGWWVDGPETMGRRGDVIEADATLMALAPDLASLALDMADWINGVCQMLVTVEGESGLTESGAALLARVERPGEGQA